MKQTIENFTWDGGSFPKAELHIRWVKLTDDNKVMTYHTIQTIRSVNTVEIVDGVEVPKVEEVRGKLHKFNHDFDYAGGNPMHEAMQSLSIYLADPTT